MSYCSDMAFDFENASDADKVKMDDEVVGVLVHLLLIRLSVLL